MLKLNLKIWSHELVEHSVRSETLGRTGSKNTVIVNDSLNVFTNLQSSVGEGNHQAYVKPAMINVMCFFSWINTQIHC